MSTPDKITSEVKSYSRTLSLGDAWLGELFLVDGRWRYPVPKPWRCEEPLLLDADTMRAIVDEIDRLNREWEGG